jgi:hypothetical protein
MKKKKNKYKVKKLPQLGISVQDISIKDIID